MEEGNHKHPVRLNLGCGDKILPGFINVDFASNWSKIKPDVVADLSQRLPFENNYADEIHSYHVIEHFQRWLLPDILYEWKRVLKHDGLIVLECPCLEKILTIIMEAIEKQIELHPSLFMWGLYGNPKYRNEAMVHKWCYSSRELMELLTELGFVDLKLESPRTHKPARDMRIVGRKP